MLIQKEKNIRVWQEPKFYIYIAYIRRVVKKQTKNRYIYNKSSNSMLKNFQ